MSDYTPKPECMCAFCGKIFIIYPYQVKTGTVQYCSNACKSVVKIVHHKPMLDYVCAYCNQSFTRHASLQPAKYCSRKCFSLSQRGANSPVWKGGHDSFRGKTWRQQRRQAFERDGGVCQHCGKPSKRNLKNPIHHIKPFRLFDGDYEAANQLENLITLCPKCHKAAEALT